MKKYILLISIIILIILSSCSPENFEPKDMIISPEINISPISGKWSMKRVVDGPHKRGTEEIQVLGDIEALFHKDGVVVGGDFVLEPSYKLRNVNLEDYLFYNYKINLDYLDIEEEEAEIISVLGQGQYFHDFIKYGEDKMFYYLDDKFVFLERKVEEVSSEEINRYISIEKSIKRVSNKKEIDTINSGLLLGIKTHYTEEESGLDKWNYRTIWIKSNNRTIGDIYEINDLLVPRKKGFYLVDVNRKNIGNVINDHIKSTPKSKDYEDFLGEEASLFASDFTERSIINYPSTLRHIIYIGNDYVSTEEINLETNKQSLRVYPTDYLEDNKPTKISNLIGEEGLSLFFQSAKDAIKTDADLILEEESFGLQRRNGYWVMKGRVNYKNEDNEFFKDFQLKTTPPKALVHYDELSIPWNIIKARIPEAIDVFTSPNEDIAVVITRNDILIYPIIENDILLNELGKIRLDNKDTVIMAEWGIGRYTGLWEEEFLKNQAEKVQDK